MSSSLESEFSRSHNIFWFTLVLRSWMVINCVLISTSSWFRYLSLLSLSLSEEESVPTTNMNHKLMIPTGWDKTLTPAHSFCRNNRTCLQECACLFTLNSIISVLVFPCRRKYIVWPSNQPTNNWTRSTLLPSNDQDSFQIQQPYLSVLHFVTFTGMLYCYPTEWTNKLVIHHNLLPLKGKCIFYFISIFLKVPTTRPIPDTRAQISLKVFNRSNGLPT